MESNPIISNSESMTCLVCGDRRTNTLYNLLLECLNCGFVWAQPGIPKSKLSSVYDDSYFFDGEYVDYLKEEEALRKNFKRNLQILSSIQPSGRLLEIGCAYGFFLDIAKQRYQVQGIEINQNACRYAKEKLGLDVVCGNFLEAPFKENSYDVITMWATLEHVLDPHLYLEKINSLLARSGIFVCSVPDIGSVLAKIQKASWRQIHPPTHLNYFSKDTLTRLLVKNNFERIKTLRLGEYRTMGLVLYKLLVKHGKPNRIYDFFKKTGLTKQDFYLNMFDTLYVIAFKK